jgi:hypothetical protein
MKDGVTEGSIATVGWPDEGNHTGNNPPVSVGGVSMPQLSVGNQVKYFGSKATVVGLSQDRKRARIHMPERHTTQNVDTADLTRLGQGDYANKKPLPRVEEVKKRSDTYHIVNKDGKPANLASYADKESAVKDRDAKHQGAEVRQLGPRGKVKGVSEVSLGDYRKKAAVSQAGAKIDRFFGRDDAAKVAAADQTIAKREKGLARADTRTRPYTPPPAAPADLEKQQRDLTAKYPNIDELVRRAELNRDPDYEMADGQAYYAARDAEQNYQKLRQIQRVIQGLNESILGFSAKDLDRLTGTKKTPDYSKKAIKYKYNQDQEPKSNKKSEPTEKQRQEYYQALGLSDSE